MSKAAQARAAGADAALGQIEDGVGRPSLDIHERLAAVLGADLAARLYPNTGPAICDRLSAAMLEAPLEPGRRGATRRPPCATPRGPVRDWRIRGTLVRPAPAPQDRTMTAPRTLVEKIWDDHVVAQEEGAPALLAIDLHLIHEVTSPQAFTGIRQRGIAGPPPGQDGRDRRPQHAHDPARPADPRPDGRRADQAARDELRRVRRPDPRLRQRHAGHRPRHRPGARPDAARHDHRLRRLAHGHPRGVRSARVRHRHERGRDGPRHPDAAPAQAEDVRGPRGRPARPGRQRQGHHPRAHREDRDRRRDRPRLRVHAARPSARSTWSSG